MQLYDFYRQSRKLYSQSLYEVILKLIKNEDHDICFLSAELLFDIYTAQSNIKQVKSEVAIRDKSEVAIRDKEMWQLATMTDDNSLLKEILTRNLKKTKKDKLDGFSEILLDEKSTLNQSFEDESESNYAVQEVAYNSGEIYNTMKVTYMV